MTTPPRTAFKKGEKRENQGKRGPNKNTAAIKDMILEALHGVGGVEYLMECAKDDKSRSAFLGLVGKVLPMQITGDGGGPVETVTRIELVAMRGDT